MLIRVSDDAVIETMGMVCIGESDGMVSIAYDTPGVMMKAELSLDELLARLASVGVEFKDARPKGKP